MTVNLPYVAKMQAFSQELAKEFADTFVAKLEKEGVPKDDKAIFYAMLGGIIFAVQSAPAALLSESDSFAEVRAHFLGFCETIFDDQAPQVLEIIKQALESMEGPPS